MKSGLLFLLAFLFIGCAPKSPYSMSAYNRGAENAKAELAKGTLMLETYGEPVSWGAAYDRILKERYGIEKRNVAGCIVNAEIIGHAKGFNNLMLKEIRKKWPADIFRSAAEEAAKQTEIKTK